MMDFVDASPLFGIFAGLCAFLMLYGLACIARATGDAIGNTWPDDIGNSLLFGMIVGIFSTVVHLGWVAMCDYATPDKPPVPVVEYWDGILEEEE